MIDLGEVRIWQATSLDMHDVTAFYEANRHENNKERGDDELLRAVRIDRKLVLASHDNVIVGSSAVFEFLDGRFREAGATRIVLNGFGLQKVLHYVRAIHEFLNWQTVPTDLLVEKNASPGARYFRLPRAELQRHATRLLELRDRRYLLRPSRSFPGEEERVSIKFEVEILRNQKAVAYVERMRAGDVGPWSE
jgi:hypothetical protein